MGSQWSAQYCCKKEENSRDPENVPTAEESPGDSAPLLKQPALQREETSRRHVETTSEENDCSDHSSAEVNAFG